MPPQGFSPIPPHCRLLGKKGGQEGAWAEALFYADGQSTILYRAQYNSQMNN
jgi:hypothetical protein